MPGRVRHVTRPLLIAAVASAVLAAASCSTSDPAGPGNSERIHRQLAVIGYLEVGGQPIGSHTVFFSAWKTDGAGESIPGSEMHFDRTTDAEGYATGSFGYELLFDTESSQYLELVRCHLSTTYEEQDLSADVLFTQHDLATGDTTKTVNLMK
jgi:hypothetical protein